MQRLLTNKIPATRCSQQGALENVIFVFNNFRGYQTFGLYTMSRLTNLTPTIAPVFAEDAVVLY